LFESRSETDASDWYSSIPARRQGRGSLSPALKRWYNLNEMTDDSAYIVVGDTTNRWRDNKLFIFDDTLLHESISQTDRARYCLFVDMIRRIPFPAVMRATVYVIRSLTESF